MLSVACALCNVLIYADSSGVFLYYNYEAILNEGFPLVENLLTVTKY